MTWDLLKTRRLRLDLDCDLHMWEPHPKEALATVSESLTKTDQNRSYHSEPYLGFTHSTNFPWVYVNGVGDYGVVRSCFTWSVKWWCVLWPGEMLGCEMRVGMKSFGQRPLSVWGQRKQHSAALFPPNHISSFLSLVSVSLSLSHKQPRRHAHTQASGADIRNKFRKWR